MQDFVTLDFIPPGTDLRPILPVLAKVRFTTLGAPHSASFRPWHGGAIAPEQLQKCTCG